MKTQPAPVLARAAGAAVLLLASSAFAAGEDAAVERLLARMTLAEKVRLCSGDHTMRLPKNDRLGIPEWWFSDSSHTIRADLRRWDWGYEDGKKPAVSTVLPTLSALAATWNVERAAEHGDVMGAQTRARGKDMFLGPGVNLMRTPLCGRNWEYFAEDPCLVSRLVVPLIRNAQKHDVAACVKHFCLNNQELNRFKVESSCDERTLREIYLPAFEAAVVEGGVLAVMNAYDKFRGVHCSESAFLQKQILRDEWGFKGLVVTDWGAMHDGVKAALGGTDVEMDRGLAIQYYNVPTNIYAQECATGTFVSDAKTQPLAEAVRAGKVPEKVVDDMVRHILHVYAQTGKLTGRARDKGALDTPRHRAVARAIGDEAIVLAKNDAGVLPLDPAKTRKVLVLGRLAEAEHARYGYSAEGMPPYEITPLAALRARLGADVEIETLPLTADGSPELPPKGALGASSSDEAARVKAIRQSGGRVAVKNAERPEPAADEAWLAKVRAKAAAADATLVFTGTWVGHGRALECEGEDRPNMLLPVGHDAMIARVLGWKLPRVVVVVHSGSPCELPWADACASLVFQPYCGQEGGRPLVDVLFGDVNPSGKFPCSWPRRYADTAVAHVGSYNTTNSFYNERFYVGYRWHDHAKIAPLFAFGHGLSYTRFAYSNVRAEGLGLAVDVTNAGARKGREAVQLYVSHPEAKVERCVRELKRFAKIELAPGETKTVRFALDLRDFAYWDDAAKRFRADAERAVLHVGASSADLRGAVSVNHGAATFTR